MAQNPNNPYEFIMSEPTKTSHLPNLPIKIKGNSFRNRLIIVAGGAVILVLILVLVFGVLLKPSTKGANAMYQVAAAQQDIIAIIDLGKANVKDQDLLYSTATISAVVNSHLYETTSDITKSSFGKNSTVKIRALRDSQYKTVLDEAKISGTYDETFKTLLSNRLDLYGSYLQSAYADVVGQSLKTQLSDEYNQANALSLAGASS
jgi:hypothetical protein